MHKPTYQTGHLDRVIHMAWDDRTTFEEIEEAFGLSEDDVIEVMRSELKPGSFRRWRKRVSGRVTKHRKKFRRRERTDPSVEDADLSGIDIEFQKSF